MGVGMFTFSAVGKAGPAGLPLGTKGSVSLACSVSLLYICKDSRAGGAAPAPKVRFLNIFLS